MKLEFAAVTMQRSFPCRDIRKSLIPMVSASERESPAERPRRSRHTLITQAPESSLAPLRGRPTHHEAHNKEVLHGDDPPLAGQMASPGQT